jgi:hypothetical protein
MKSIDSLDDEQKGMLRFLGKKEDAEEINDIRKYLSQGGYGSISEKVARDKLDELIDLGYVRSKTEGKPGNKTERFYLSKGVGAGRRARATLQGRNYVWGDLGSLIKRITGAALVLFGVGVFVYQTPSLSGAVISNANLKGGNFILPISSLILGGLLLFKSLKSKPTKKKEK